MDLSLGLKDTEARESFWDSTSSADLAAKVSLPLLLLPPLPPPLPPAVLEQERNRRDSIKKTESARARLMLISAFK